jgi:hypothetical protein
MWPDKSAVNPDYMIPFKTHDNVTPVCGKIGFYEGKVGIMTENCLRHLPFSHKVPLGSEPGDSDESTVITHPDPDEGGVELIIVPDEPDPFSEFNFTRPRSKKTWCPMSKKSLGLKKMARFLSNSYEIP